MSYLVKEVFPTIQGEGFWTGRAAVFVRMSRCNLWSGREEDRSTAICQFCDTDFLHGERMDLQTLLGMVSGLGLDFVVLTGGEPTLQVDKDLIEGLHERGYYIAIETNGTRTVPDGIDWVCVSPKAGTTIVTTFGDELKLVYPQADAAPEEFENWGFRHFWVSPMDGPNLASNTTAAYEYVLAHPRWRLNTQMHKQIGVR
jgi:7-carboxy-7-deazaguanine synthase